MQQKERLGNKLEKEHESASKLDGSCNEHEGKQQAESLSHVAEKEHKKDRKHIREKFLQYFPVSAILITALVIRLFAAFYAEGFVHPDEVFQSIEIVHYRIFGEYGEGVTIPWEYDLEATNGGARSWFFVLILEVVYRFMMAIGINNTLSLITGLRVFLAVTSTVTVLITYLLGKEAFNRTTGLVASFIVATWWFFPFWSSRTMTDSLSTDMLLAAIYLAFRVYSRRNASLKKHSILAVFAGIFTGLAFMIRFPAGLIGLPIFVLMLVIALKELKEKMAGNKELTISQKLRPFAVPIAFVFGSFLMIMVQGVLDVFTWGSFLHSPINFFEYNIVKGYNELHGTAPWYDYIVSFYDDFAFIFLPLFVVFFFIGLEFDIKPERTVIFLVFSGYWLVIFSMIGHKEFRFIMAILPLLIILAANGIYKILLIIRQKSLQITALSVILLSFSASSLYLATNNYSGWWQFNKGICHTMHWVGQQNDSELLIAFQGNWYTGGYAYLDKNITTIFRSINRLMPYYHANTSLYKYYYSLPGTYVIVTNWGNFLLEDIFLENGLSLVHNVSGPYYTAYVYS